MSEEQNNMYGLDRDMRRTIAELMSRAAKKAQEHGQEMISIDHLALSVLDIEHIKKILGELDVDNKSVIEDIEHMIEQYVFSCEDVKQISMGNIEISEDLGSLIEYAFTSTAHILSTNKKSSPANVVCEEVLRAILNLDPSDSISSAVFKKHNLSNFKLSSHLQSKKSPMGGSNSNDKNDDLNVLKKSGYVVDMLENIDNYENLIGREEEIERMIQALSRKKKHNVIFVGDPGVGKTALMQGVAKKIKAGDVPSSIKDIHLFSLDLVNIMAGAHYRGELESRLKNVIEIIGNHKGVLFIDEFHALLSATQGQNSGLDAANALKPILNNNDIRVVGTTTHSEFKNIIEKDKGFSRHFQVIDLTEPTHEQTLNIIKGMIGSLSNYHKVKYSEDSFNAAIKLSARYIPDRHFPDKAIDVLDEAGARHSSGVDFVKNLLIESSHVEKIIGKIAKVNLGEVNKSEAERLKNIEKELMDKIFGQDDAISQICKSIRLGRAGLAGKEKPIGAYVLAGSTGVGKTELAKQVSKSLDVELVRFDMSEYMEKHSVSRLIGSPPGYVGYDEGGLLTDKVSKYSNCVLLLDEIEKAHPDILQVLLQVMSDGKLTDAKGRETNFKNTIIMMTTNLGASEAAQNTVGFTKPLNAESNEKREAAINKNLPPEFINRVDSIIHFNSLNEKHVVKVVEKELNNRNKDLLDSNIVIEATDDVKKFLASSGYDPKMGARPIQRIIKDKIMVPLSEEILFGKLVNGGKVKCLMSKGKLSLEFIAKDEMSADTLLNFLTVLNAIDIKF